MSQWLSDLLCEYFLNIELKVCLIQTHDKIFGRKQNQDQNIDRGREKKWKNRRTKTYKGVEQRLKEGKSKDWKRGRVEIERGEEQRLKEGESNGVAEASVKSCDPAQSLGRLKAEESDISSPDFLQLRNPHPIITHHHLAVVQHTAAQQWIIIATRLGGIAGDFTVATTQGHRGTTAIKVE